MGDEVLKGVAEVCRAKLPPHVLLARHGGEEFVVLTTQNAQEIAEQLRSGVEQHQFKTDKGASLSVTLSLGIASRVSAAGPSEAGPSSEDLSALLIRADRALYEAKSAGRNRAVTA
jgi:two-component system, cell cycle response regulator